MPGAGLSIFADAPTPTAAGEGACNILDQSKAGQPCTGKGYNDTGSDVELTVTQAGTFEIQGGPPRGKKIPVIAAIGVKRADGNVVLADARAPVASASASASAPPSAAIEPAAGATVAKPAASAKKK